jgi:hypothetical protein
LIGFQTADLCRADIQGKVIISEKKLGISKAKTIIVLFDWSRKLEINPEK